MLGLMAKYIIMLHRADIFKSLMSSMCHLPTSVISSCIFTIVLEGLAYQRDRAACEVLYDILL